MGVKKRNEYQHSLSKSRMLVQWSPTQFLHSPALLSSARDSNHQGVTKPTVKVTVPSTAHSATNRGTSTSPTFMVTRKNQVSFRDYPENFADVSVFKTRS